jgi:hypothetical protein
MTNSQLIAALNWRYAVKQFDAAKKIAPDTWAAIEDSLSLVSAPLDFSLSQFEEQINQDPKLACEKFRRKVFQTIRQ